MTSIGFRSHHHRGQTRPQATNLLTRFGIVAALILAAMSAWWSIASWLADSLIASMLVGVAFVTLAPLLGASHTHHR